MIKTEVYLIEANAYCFKEHGFSSTAAFWLA